MRWVMPILFAALAFSVIPLFSAVFVAADAEVVRRIEQPFVVHEWGTFTSFAGADGVKLEFRPLADNDLPGFVFDRARQAGYIRSPFSKVGFFAVQRMETPVTYFYTDREREVEVSVGFPQGLLTEFFPPVKRMTPDFKLLKPAGLKDSLLDWGKVRLLPPEAFAKLQQQTPEGGTPPRLPEVKGKNHYEYARETDSAIVETGGHPLAKGKQYEKFLFYRGIGNFRLPLKLTALSENRFQLENLGPDVVGSLFLVRVRDGKVRFSLYDQIDAGERLEMAVPQSDSTLQQLSEAVVQRLIGTGLFEKEARSMVKTWRDSWFEEEGVRLFYVVPERIVEEMLPLKITPQPDAVVRTLVGRLEIMTPDSEAKLASLVKAAANGKDKQAQQALHNYLKTLGRFAEPALDRVRRATKDVETKTTAARLLTPFLQAALAASQ